MPLTACVKHVKALMGHLHIYFRQKTNIILYSNAVFFLQIKNYLSTQQLSAVVRCIKC